MTHKTNVRKEIKCNYFSSCHFSGIHRGVAECWSFLGSYIFSTGK